jgi:hypothetical protein
MGNEFVGIVHPSKLYNILTVGSPFLYIGREDCWRDCVNVGQIR